MTVLAKVLVCIAGSEQGVGHRFFVNPVARNHSSKTEGHGIERLVTLAVGGGTKLGGSAFECCCSISLATRAAIRSWNVGKAARILIDPVVWLPSWADNVR